MTTSGYEANSYTKVLPNEHRHVWRERLGAKWSVRVIRVLGRQLEREMMDAFSTAEEAMAWAEDPARGSGTA